MLKRLKIKFILLSMTSLLVLLTAIVAGMNLINYHAVVAEADEILVLLSQNKGTFPGLGGDKNDKREPPPHGMSPELPYESRYFSVLLDSTGSVILTDTSRIAAVDSQTAIDYAGEVFAESAVSGFADAFRFVKNEEGDRVRIIFLDCGRKLDSFRHFFLVSAGMALAGFVIVFFVISLAAGKIIRPIAESYEKQKRFITDAGHEIKTPLTIISANADLLELDLGPNECLADIQQQTKRLASLTNELVLLARMEETGNPLPMIDFPVSEVVADAAAPFQTLAGSQGKQLSCEIEPLLSMRGNDKAIRQLVSILLDNAVKYSPKGGLITLKLAGQAKALQLTVCNTTAAGISREALGHVFDRFYRADPSRNSESGGHGIGLSVAKAIVTAHGGRIQALSPDGHSFQIVASLPI